MEVNGNQGNRMKSIKSSLIITSQSITGLDVMYEKDIHIVN